MGDSSDGMCTKCGGENDDDGGGGLCMKCKAVPSLSVAKVKLRMLEKGMDVATPEFENAQYDLLVRNLDDGKWYPLQVKTAYNGWVNTCRPNSKGRSPYSSYDVCGIAIVDGMDVFVLPLEECKNGGRMKMEYIRANYEPIGA